MKIKICGLTREEDVLESVRLGAWALGFIHHPGSPRYVTPAQTRDLTRRVPSEVRTVGVFVNSSAEQVARAVAESGVSMVQLHGDESPEFCDLLPFEKIKALPPDDSFKRYRDVRVLLDSRAPGQYGGTGIPLDWSAAGRIARAVPVILSGGLKSENVRLAIALVRPEAVDVSSGVESAPGIKDHDKLKMFFKEASK